jgi:hypothetical protein
MRNPAKGEGWDFVAVKAQAVQDMVAQGVVAQGVGQECKETGQEQNSMTTDMTQIVRCFSFF